MKIKDILIIKHGNNVVKEMVYLASTQTQHLFSDIENLVGVNKKAILWAGDVGATKFLPIKKKHNFIQVNENKWELNVEPIEVDDL
jgi:hypothetical protein